MEEAVAQFTIPFAILAVALFVAGGLIWIFKDHGIDKIKHTEEWQNAGSSGEQIIYTTLIKQFRIPETQIFRNVYIPIKNGKTTEIDLIVVSKKGLFVFECKNYGGNIYGDAKREKWIQYIGKQKNYFYNPILQNRNHAKALRSFLNKEAEGVPIIPLTTSISRGNWKIKNLGAEDYFLGINCHLKDVYGSLSDSPEMAKYFKTILKKLAPLARPDDEARQKHIRQINK